MDAATKEENETIQDMWAGLLANATDPKIKLQIKKVIISVLSELNQWMLKY